MAATSLWAVTGDADPGAATLAELAGQVELPLRDAADQESLIRGGAADLLYAIGAPAAPAVWSALRANVAPHPETLVLLLGNIAADDEAVEQQLRRDLAGANGLERDWLLKALERCEARRQEIAGFEPVLRAYPPPEPDGDPEADPVAAEVERLFVSLAGDATEADAKGSARCEHESSPSSRPAC
jgi:hypothetical protein